MDAFNPVPLITAARAEPIVQLRVLDDISVTVWLVFHLLSPSFTSNHQRSALSTSYRCPILPAVASFKRPTEVRPGCTTSLPHSSDAMAKIHVDDTNKSAILDIISYQPRDQYRAGITLAGPASKVDFKPPTASIGSLDVLPLELFDFVLKYSAMHTVSTLRAVNRRMRLLVDASPPHKDIISSAPHIRATFERTGVGSHYSVEEVFWTLTHPACRVCGNFGLYLWIPECERCCYNCLKEDPDLMPMPARAAFGLTKSQMARIPIMISLPGDYTILGTSRRRPVKFVSQKRARQLGLAVHGSEEKLAKYTSSSNSKAKADYDKKVNDRNRMACYDSHGRVNISIDHIHRYLVTVHFQYLDLSSRTTNTGLACHGCLVAANRKSSLSSPSLDGHALICLRDRIYTEEGILDHLKECQDAQALWRVSPYKDQVCGRWHKTMLQFQEYDSHTLDGLCFFIPNRR